MFLVDCVDFVVTGFPPTPAPHVLPSAGIYGSWEGSRTFWLDHFLTSTKATHKAPYGYTKKRLQILFDHYGFCQ